jgi:hypothetical protein
MYIHMYANTYFHNLFRHPNESANYSINVSPDNQDNLEAMMCFLERGEIWK